MRPQGKMILASLALLVATPLVADDLTGATAFLCSAGHAVKCSADGDCDSGPAWNFNLPQFIQIDLAKKRVSTTEASADSRATDIKHMDRNEGEIILHGDQNGRAFTFVIDEETGTGTVAVALTDRSVVVFVVCTPMPGPPKSN